MSSSEAPADAKPSVAETKAADEPVTEVKVHESVAEPPKPQKKKSSSAEDLAKANEFKAEGNKLFSAQQFQQAVAQYSKAIAVAPDQPAFLGNRSAAFFMLKQYNESLRDCQAALELDPVMLKCLQRASRVLIFRGEFDLALQYLKRALAVDAGDKESKENLALATQLQQELAQGDALMAAGRHRQAQLVFDKLELACPLASYIAMRAARAYIAQKNYSVAMRSCLQVMKSDPNYAEAYFVRGQAFYLSENYEQALKHYQECLRREPDHVPAQTELKKVKAIEKLGKQARDLAFVRKFDEAIPVFTEVLAVDPDNKALCAKLTAERGECYYRLGQPEKAVADCTTAIYLHSQQSAPYFTRALGYAALNRLEMAIRDMETVLHEVEPNSRLAYERMEKYKFELRKQKRADYYAILGVPHVATIPEIKAGYKKTALEKHPDRFPDAKERAAAELAFRSVAEAYEVLSDPFMKGLYDEGHDIESIREKVAVEAKKKEEQARRGGGSRGGGGGGGHGHSHGAGGDHHGHSHGAGGHGHAH